MKIEINPPARRSLTPNEKAVYEHLKNGMTPQEICRKMHIRMGTGWADNLHDVPFETFRRLVCSIREKGWEIPGENINRKENETMSATITQEKIEEIRQLRKEGMSIHEIEEKTGISHGTISKYTKKEPAAATTTTDSGCNESNLQSTYIVSPHEEDVKPVISRVIPQAVIEACWGRKSELKDQIAQEQAVIDDWERQIAEIDDFLELAKLCNPMGGTI